MKKGPSLFILFLLVSFASVSAVLFTPGLPQIAQDLQISQGTAQLTITIFLIGYALGLLPWGPLSERLGRKPPIYWGISIAILGCLLTLLIQKFHSLPLFLIGRLLTALGSSVGLKVAFTMVGDTYQHEKATKAISHLMLSFAIAPAVSVAIGGFLTTHFGWASCFYFLTGYSIFLFILALFLPETSQRKDLHALKLRTIAEGYLQKIRNKKLITCALMMGCGAAVIYLFAAEAPFIGIERIGLSPEKYGYLNFIPPVGLVIGALLANYLSGRRPPLSIMLIGTLIAIACTASLLTFFLFDIVNPWTLFLPMPFLYIGESLVYANATSLILTHAKNKSYASATMSFITMGSCVAALFIFGSLPTHGTALMPLMFTAIAIAMLLLLGVLRTIFKSEQ